MGVQTRARVRERARAHLSELELRGFIELDVLFEPLVRHRLRFQLGAARGDNLHLLLAPLDLPEAKACREGLWEGCTHMRCFKKKYEAASPKMDIHM